MSGLSGLQQGVMGMIRYLEQNEKQRTRAMYEANFPEDSEQFIDYYYEWKRKDNQILVMEEKEEQMSFLRTEEMAETGDGFQVMLHLNPYEFRICKEAVKLNYIVAVATDASVRKQGKMAEVMKCALLDMAKEHQPFTFLIPANPKVYLSSGFAFVPSETYEAYRWQVAEVAQEQVLQAAEVTQEQSLQEAEVAQEQSLQEVEVTQEQTLQAAEVSRNQADVIALEGAKWKDAADICLWEATTEDIPAITAFANDLLGQEYHIFPFRTAEYYQRMLEELKSENGALVLLGQHGKLIGCFSYGKEGTNIELQEILLHPDYRGQFGELVKGYFKGCQMNITKMDYMVRILDLRVLGLLLRSEEPCSLKVRVRDDMIETNNGCFEIKADAAGSSISAIAPEEAECSMDIAQLTEFLFGRMKFFIREWV